MIALKVVVLFLVLVVLRAWWKIVSPRPGTETFLLSITIGGMLSLASLLLVASIALPWLR